MDSEASQKRNCNARTCELPIAKSAALPARRETLRKTLFRRAVLVRIVVLVFLRELGPQHHQRIFHLLVEDLLVEDGKLFPQSDSSQWPAWPSTRSDSSVPDCLVRQ